MPAFSSVITTLYIIVSFGSFCCFVYADEVGNTAADTQWTLRQSADHWQTGETTVNPSRRGPPVSLSVRPTKRSSTMSNPAEPALIDIFQPL